MSLTKRMLESLDNHITGNYGEDQYRESRELDNRMRLAYLKAHDWLKRGESIAPASKFALAYLRLQARKLEE